MTEIEKLPVPAPSFEHEGIRYTLEAGKIVREGSEVAVLVPHS